MTRWQSTHCPVCRRLLLHRVGAAILLCPSCHSLLNLHAHPSTPGQTACLNCTTIIHHPIGPPLLQCRICAATTPAPVLNYICRGCSLYLAYSSSLPAVLCPICHTVEPPIETPVSRFPVLLPLDHTAPPRPCPPLPPRHIPWLPSTPVRPVSVPRPASQPRISPQSGILMSSQPQQLSSQDLDVHLSTASAPTPPVPLSEPSQSSHFTSIHQAPFQSTSASELHSQQPYEQESAVQYSQAQESPHEEQQVALGGEKFSMNGGDDNGAPDHENEGAAQSSSPPISSKDVDVDSDHKD